MGQVPERANTLLVGDGRLANHLHHFFKLSNLPHWRWSRRRGAIGFEEKRPPLDELIAGADRVLLAIRDDAIGDFARRHKTDQQKTDEGRLWVHFSGSTLVDGVWSAHPLCTFAFSPYSLDTYASIPFIVEQEGPAFERLLPGLPNPSAAIPRQAKPLYHALCVSAGNFTQLLWQQLFSAFESKLGLPAELAAPYLRQTCRNLEQNVGRDVLTGPLARRDHQTIEHNLASLRDADLTSLANVYEAFLKLADFNTLEIA